MFSQDDDDVKIAIGTACRRTLAVIFGGACAGGLYAAIRGVVRPYRYVFAFGGNAGLVGFQCFILNLGLSRTFPNYPRTTSVSAGVLGGGAAATLAFGPIAGVKAGLACGMLGLVFNEVGTYMTEE